MSTRTWVHNLPMLYVCVCICACMHVGVYISFLKFQLHLKGYRCLVYFHLILFLSMYFIFGCFRSSSLLRTFIVAHEAFSSCWASASHCGHFSCRWWVLGHPGFSSCGAGPWFPCGTWYLPQPGIEPVFLHWQGESQPLNHQGSPCISILELKLLRSKRIHMTLFSGKAMFPGLIG